MAFSARVNRRVFGGMASAGLIAPWLRSAGAQEPPKPPGIVFNGPVGDSLVAARAVFYAEYEKRFGIKVIETGPSSMAKLRAMVDARNVEWTIAEVGGEDAIVAERLGLFEQIDRQIVPMDTLIKPLDERRVTAPRNFYSTTLAYRRDGFRNGKVPTSWADFWDVRNFPGPRSLRDRAIDNLEFALLADGVSVDNLYPLDVDRAFRKLDQIKPHVAVWWNGGQQPAQLLIDKEVVMTSGWNGRFYKLQREDAGIDIAWAGSMVKVGTFGVVKGAPQAYWGQKMLGLSLDPKLQAAYAERVGYPGTNPKCWEHISPTLHKFFPTAPENISKIAWTNDAWWSERGATVEDRFKRWLLVR